LRFHLRASALRVNARDLVFVAEERSLRKSGCGIVHEKWYITCGDESPDWRDRNSFADYPFLRAGFTRRIG
jgi:hypothetical protein